MAFVEEIMPQSLNNNKFQEMQSYLKSSGMILPTSTEKREHLATKYSEEEINEFLKKSNKSILSKILFNPSRKIKTLIWLIIATSLTFAFIYLPFNINDFNLKAQVMHNPVIEFSYQAIHFLILAVIVAIVLNLLISNKQSRRFKLRKRVKQNSKKN